MMFKRLKEIKIYLIITAAVFYVMPVIFALSTSEETVAFWNLILLWLFFPALCAAGGVVLGFRQGFVLCYPLCVGALFVPTLFFYYNFSAWVYILVYGVLALAGNLVGSIFYSKKSRLQNGA